MPATNSTTNLQLPQYVNTDEPKYIPDFNDAMQKIDAGYENNLTKINKNAADIASQATDIQNIEGDATQALNTANQALVATNNLINIDDITITISSGELRHSFATVINGVFIMHCHIINATVGQPFVINLNYKINSFATTISNIISYSEYSVVDGTITLPSEVIGGNYTVTNILVPWSIAWTKKEATE